MATQTSIPYGSVVFHSFKDNRDNEHNISFQYIKAPRVTPVPKSLLNKKKVPASSLLPSGGSMDGSGEKKITTMKDWVIARLQHMPDDAKVTGDAVTKFVEIANNVVTTLKNGLKSMAEGEKLKGENLATIEQDTQKLLSLNEELDTESNLGLAIPANFFKDSSMDEEVAAFLGVVVGNYFESYILQPTFDRTRTSTAKGKTVEVRAANVEQTRKLLQGLHTSSK